jgi:hypothetical protein
MHGLVLDDHGLLRLFRSAWAVRAQLVQSKLAPKRATVEPILALEGSIQARSSDDGVAGDWVDRVPTISPHEPSSGSRRLYTRSGA